MGLSELNSVRYAHEEKLHSHITWFNSVPFFPLLAVIVSLVHAQPVCGHHGGEVRLMEQAGPFLITVFTEPMPLRAGPVDIGIMVQGDRGRPILTAAVAVLLREKDLDTPPIRAVATRQRSTNLLLYTASVDLPTPGLWNLHVHVRHNATVANVACEVMAEQRQFWLFTAWPYLTLLLVAIGLCVFRRRLVTRATQRPRP